MNLCPTEKKKKSEAESKRLPSKSFCVDNFGRFFGRYFLLFYSERKTLNREKLLLMQFALEFFEKHVHFGNTTEKKNKKTIESDFE